MIISSSLRARFGNTLESHQIDDDYSDPTDDEVVNSSPLPQPQLQSSTPSHASTSTIPQQQQQQQQQQSQSQSQSQQSQQWSHSTRTSSSALTSLNCDSSTHGFNSAPSCLPHQTSYTSLSQNDAYLNELQFDPEEPVPTYETSQLMHQNNRAQPTEIEPVQRVSIDGQYTARELPRGLASHLYTPIPSLPIPRTSSMFFSDSVESSVSTTPILLQQSSQQSQLQGNSHSPHHTLSSNTSSSTSTQFRNKFKQTSIKKLGLKFLNARQHFLLASCRDISLIPPLFGLYQSWTRIYQDNDPMNATSYKITTARGLEHFLTGVWCIVAAYLSYSILDSLLVRWIITYSTSAAIVRVLSMSTIMIFCELYMVSTFSADGYKYGLHIWILISCLLTFTYIVQNFVTSNLQLEHHNNVKLHEPVRGSGGGAGGGGAGGGNGENEVDNSATSSTPTTSSRTENSNTAGRTNIKHHGQMRMKKPRRFFDFYNIVVFAVVPVGLASFVTMIGLLRSLLILRIDVDQVMKNVG
ncbi:hypothetical protein KGF57_001355 [Candida theae]|uniref:N-glycosylation protein EOS1 n=1 Tax=Candida theae TaxID=1198502 RepID=A0AAD5BHR2_9ASCO|nr:uncharacterized protein KGF57_001355 [Candida theae]KAI5962915.1 hypothetical protein KGF57_001355 [Candida theae]